MLKCGLPFSVSNSRTDKGPKSDGKSQDLIFQHLLSRDLVMTAKVTASQPPCTTGKEPTDSVLVYALLESIWGSSVGSVNVSHA